MTRHTLYSALLLAATLAPFHVSVSAQFGQLPNPVICPRKPFGETDLAWKERCEAEEEAERNKATERMRADMLARVKETERQRAALEKQAPLPAARNRLLGRWQAVAPAGDAFEQLITSVAGCSTLFGEGTLEFEAGRWGVSGRAGRRDMGRVSYRGGADGGVVALPTESDVFALLPFEFLSPDRVHLTNTTCTLVRTTAAAPAGRASGTATPPAAAPNRLLMLKDNMGYQCPDGQQLAIQSCDQSCLVVRVDLPPKNGFEVTFIDEPAALLKRVASCTPRKVVLKNGVLALVP